MRLPLVPMMIVLLVNVVIDYYIWRVARGRCRSKVPSRIQLISASLIYLGLFVTICLPRRSGSDDTLAIVMWLLFGYFSVLVSKALFVIFDLLASLPRIFGRRRVRWISLAGGVLAVVAFLAMWWGALVNRFRIDVKEVTVEIAGLPQEFDGFTIAQFSDFHVGTYGSDTTYVSHVVDRINSLDTDLIVFTGDIVNRRTEELLPFVGPLSRLDAPYGVYSILGNHDYGDYCEWESPTAKQANMDEMYRLQKNMHWTLLLNEHEWLRRGNDSIALVGVENVGDPPFKIYGSLPQAYPTLSDDVTKILLSHNPAHWTDDIADNDSINVALTLSGHTHAMQIEVLGWSPAVFRYPTWGGLYSDSSQKSQLYVNIGLGAVGIPMRLGATPEITVLTLRRARTE
ncbi:MAG: metallophosphoesterase [Barnesiella sp.]|nr:metallophosphoesterase [Barnesiella sp.]